MAERGAPAHIRSDNGSEFVARTLQSEAVLASEALNHLSHHSTVINIQGEDYHSKKSVLPASSNLNRRTHPENQLAKAETLSPALSVYGRVNFRRAKAGQISTSVDPN